MDEQLLELIKKIIKDKGTYPPVATFAQVRHEAEALGDKKLLNKAFRALREDGKIGIREGINQKLIYVL